MREPRDGAVREFLLDPFLEVANRRHLAVRPLQVFSAQLHGYSPSCRLFRSEEHTSELQSLMRNSYAIFCLKKKQSNPRPQEQSDQSHYHLQEQNHYTHKTTQIDHKPTKY